MESIATLPQLFRASRGKEWVVGIFFWPDTQREEFVPIFLVSRRRRDAKRLLRTVARKRRRSQTELLKWLATAHKRSLSLQAMVLILKVLAGPECKVPFESLFQILQSRWLPRLGPASLGGTEAPTLVLSETSIAFVCLPGLAKLGRYGLKTAPIIPRPAPFIPETLAPHHERPAIYSETVPTARPGRRKPVSSGQLSLF